MNLPTRSANQHDHPLQTPTRFVRAPLPGMRNATAIVHTSPAGGSAFVQYTAEFERGGVLAACGDQRFVYVIEGRRGTAPSVLEQAAFAYIPSGQATGVCSDGTARAVIIEKPYQPLAGVDGPALLTGRETDGASTDPRDGSL